MEEENDNVSKGMYSATAGVLKIAYMPEEYANIMKVKFSVDSDEVKEERKRNLKQLNDILIYLEKEKLISFSILTSSYSNDKTYAYILNERIKIEEPVKHSNFGFIIGIEKNLKQNATSYRYPYFMWFYKPIIKIPGKELTLDDIHIISINMETMPDEYITRIYQNLMELLEK